MFAATAELYRQLMCISKCHWQVYSSFSSRNWLSRTLAPQQLAPRQNKVLLTDGIGLLTVPEWPKQSQNWPLVSRVLDVPVAAFVPELCLEPWSMVILYDVHTYVLVNKYSQSVNTLRTTSFGIASIFNYLLFLPNLWSSDHVVLISHWFISLKLTMTKRTAVAIDRRLVK